MKHSSTHATEHDRDPGIACRNPDCRSPEPPRRLRRGHCDPCYQRDLVAGFPESGVPSPCDRPSGPCRNPRCGKRFLLVNLTFGYCQHCHHRWAAAGFPDSGLPEPRRGPSAARREDYAWLRSQGVSPQEAAARIGLTLRTVMKPGRGYERCEPALVSEAALCARSAESCSP